MTDFKTPESMPQETTIRLGQWFNPFVNYEDTPYHKKVENYHDKNFLIPVEEVGLMHVMLTYSDSEAEHEHRRSHDQTSILVLPNENRFIKLIDISEEQKRMESRLVEFAIDNYDKRWNHNDFPYGVEVRLPDGTEVQLNDYEGNAGEHIFLDGVVKNTLEEFSTLEIPEVERILDKIKVRFFRKPTKVGQVIEVGNAEKFPRNN